MKLKLEKNQVVTIVGISSMMAMTFKHHFRFTGDYDVSGKPIFREAKKGARKKFTLKIFPHVDDSDYSLEIKADNDMLIFAGTTGPLPIASGCPILIDSEAPAVPSPTGMMVTSYRGNACINFSTDEPLEVKALIESGNYNDAFSKHDAILAWPTDGNDQPVRVYDVESSHAIINQYKTKEVTA